MVTKKIKFSTDALVIKEMNIGESDKLITLLSKDYGIIKAFASGARKMNSKKFSSCSLLSFANFSIVKVNDTYKIYESNSIESFFDAGIDISVLSLAQYFCELAACFSPVETSADEYLRLILNSLYFLVKQKMKLSVLKAITELRICAMAGYMPNLVACEKCALYEDDLMYFNVLSGNLYCRECKGDSGYERSVDRTVLTALRHIVFSEFSKLYSFDIPEAAADYLTSITEEFLLLHCERKFLTLDLYNSIK